MATDVYVISAGEGAEMEGSTADLEISGNMQQECWFGLWNAPGSGRIIRVHRTDIEQIGGRNNPLPGNNCYTNQHLIQRISSYGAGGVTLTPKKLDTAATSLPAQVVCLGDVPVVTVTSTFRKACTLGNESVSASSAGGVADVSCMGSKTWHGSRTFDASGLYRGGYIDASGQGLVFREGQGLAISTGQVTEAFTYDLIVTFQVGVYTYVAHSNIRPIITDTPFVLFNGVGSGVILTILDISLHAASDFYDSASTTYSYYFGKYDIQMLEWADISIGRDAVVLPMDASLSRTLPTGIYAKIGFKARRRGTRGSMASINLCPDNKSANDSYSRVRFIGRVTYPKSNENQTQSDFGLQIPLMCSCLPRAAANGKTSPIELHEGQGIGIYKRDYGTGPRCQAMIIFDLQPATITAYPGSTGLLPVVGPSARIRRI